MRAIEDPGITIHLTRLEALQLLDSLRVIFSGGFRLGAGLTFDKVHAPTDELRHVLLEAIR